MKKLFFFRSSGGNGSSNANPRTAVDKQVYLEKPSESGMGGQDSDQGEHNYHSPSGGRSKSRKQVADIQVSAALRRSRSLSSAAFLVDGLGETSSNDPCRSPCSSTSNGWHHQGNHSSRHRCFTPERQSRGRQFEIEGTHTSEMPAYGFSKTRSDSSGSSSSCSSNVSSKVVDRYIDGEEHLERSKQKANSSKRNFSGNGNVYGKLPPRVQYTAPSSPSDGEKRKPHSFREGKGTHLHFSSTDWVENRFGCESPRRLARSVIERLSQTHGRSSAKDVSHEPITIQDVYGGSMNKIFDSDANRVALKNVPPGERYESVNEYTGEDFSEYHQQKCLRRNSYEGLNFSGTEEDVDLELERKSKEAEERVILLSEELEQQSFLSDCGFDVSSLVQAVRKLAEERVGLVLEISSLLQSRISERASAKEEIRLTKAELELHTRRLEKEKNELQAGLEKELDRRSSDWSFKLEKYQLEEKRLRERVRELAEQNVSLQREVSSFHERETEARNMITYSDRQVKELTVQVKEVSEENRDLRQNLSELQERHRGTVEDLDCMRRNFEEKEKECRELQKSVTRLLRTCSEQEKTIEGLHDGLSEEIKKHQPEKFDHLVRKLQMEQMRLTGVELSLRKEVESGRLEADSLRHENICLLNRLKGNGKEVDALTFKLDSELRTRICYLQDQGLSMLDESSQLCSKLLKFVKGKVVQYPETDQGFDMINNGLDEQFVIESEMKVQGIRRGAENLKRSLQTMSTLLQEKSGLVASKTEMPGTNIERSKELRDQTPEDAIRIELKAETLITGLLREKLYSKEQEVEQLQAELATAVRGNDVLRCEVQSALDNLSCTTHRSKDLEVQMLKKDENITRLQIDLQESTKELSVLKGILRKVSDERDMIWAELKKYSEKNMLLNAEVNALKKKMEALDEEILLKEGQITILKDTLGSKHFDLLSSPDFPKDFLVE